MTSSHLRPVIYFSLFLMNTFLVVDARAETEALVLEGVTQDIIDNDISDEMEDEVCADDSGIQNDVEKPFFSFFDGPTEYISSNIESLARNMDEFFSNERDLYETSSSRLRLGYITTLSEGGVITHDSDVNFKLRLPNTEKNLKLFFESSTEDKPYETPTKTETTPTTAEEGDFLLGVQRESGEKRGWKYKPKLGIKLRSRIESFAKFRFSREYEFGKWKINWNETPYWYKSIGWGFDSYFEINRKVSEADLFRSSTFAGWKKDTGNFDLNQVFSMFHFIDNKKALSYYAGIYGVSEPSVHTTSYLLGLTYRQNVHKNYLFIVLSPRIVLQETNNFDAENSIMFRIEMVFKK